jgi:hypothetical protein
MKQVVVQNPVINSPFREPRRHFRFIGESVIHDLQELRNRREQKVVFLLAKLTLDTGEKKKDKEARVTTAQRLWIPAVNNHDEFGRWAFLEISDPWDAKNEVAKHLTDSWEESAK